MPFRSSKPLHVITDVMFLLLGVLSASFGVTGFLVPNELIDGGVTGICMLLALVTGVSLPLLIALLNLPFLILAWRLLGRRITIIGAVTIAMFSVALALIPFPPVTDDVLLGALFGGLFLGAGIGLAIRGGSILDGTEVFALVVSRRSAFRVGDVILMVNALIFLSGVSQIGMENTMYSILTYFAASRAIDFLIYGIDEFSGMLIFSRNEDQVREFIIRETRRGVTVLKAEGGYEREPMNVLFCVATRLEVPRIKEFISTVDESAFTVNFPVSDAVGGLTHRGRRAH